MKIAIIGPFSPYRGGIQHFNTLLYRTLSKNHDVSAVNLKRQYPGFLFPGTSQYDSTAPEAEFGSRLLDPLNPWSWRRTAQHVAGLGTELAIYKYWMPFFAPAFGSLAKRLRRLGGIKTLCVIDNLTPHENRPGDRILNRYLVRHTDAFICMSGPVEAELLRLKPGAKYRKSPHPAYINFGAPLAKADARRKLGLGDKPVLLYFGFIRPYKGVLTLLDALPAINERLVATTIIAGEFYESKVPYLEKMDALNLTSHVRLEDRFIPDDEVNLYFSAADAVVLPYRSATQSGIVSIALHYNLPAIVTDVGGLPEVVQHGETGLVVPPNDPAALAEAVIDYFENRDREAMARHIASERDLYSWETLGARIEELADELRR